MSSSSSKWAAFGLAAFALTAACDDPAPPVAQSTKVQQVLSPGCTGATPPVGFFAQTKINIKSIDRTYDWLVPPKHDGHHPIPVIFVFGGDGQSGADIRAEYKLEDVVAGNTIFVYPDPTGTNKQWDLDHGADNNNDLLLFTGIIDALGNAYCIDENRIFVTGHSRGAYFANQVSCQDGSFVRAVASHGGGGPSGDTYDDNGNLQCPEKPVAALITHGTDDQVVALSEGQATKAYWASVNSCRNGGLQPFDPSPCINLLNCATDRPVVYCEVPGIGHNLWSEAPKATWNFFSQL
jgi:polyhydroxybutyrate depolymerase